MLTTIRVYMTKLLTLISNQIKYKLIRIILVITLLILLAIIYLRYDLNASILNHNDQKSPPTLSTKNTDLISENIFKYLNYKHAELRFDFNTSNNVTDFDESIVPDIVHYVQLKNPYFDFITLISVMSVCKHHKPKLIMIHSDCKLLKGKYWEQILELNTSQSGTTIHLNQIKRPKYIFQKKLSSVYHASDIARIRILKKFGGIYLDNDVYVVKSLQPFRKFEFAIGWPENRYIGTQILICHKNARFLQLWYASYRNYKANLWYYNAGQLPTDKILKPMPSLVHRVKKQFGVDNLVPMLYNELNPYWQVEYYAIHLLARHRSYMSTKADEIQYFNEYNIRQYNRTFGQMARLVYFGTITPMED